MECFFTRRGNRYTMGKPVSCFVAHETKMRIKKALAFLITLYKVFDADQVSRKLFRMPRNKAGIDVTEDCVWVQMGNVGAGFDKANFICLDRTK